MKSYVIVAAAISFAFLARASAQSGSDSPAPAAKPEVSYILAEFSQTLNARKLKPGDPIKAQVSQDVLAHGKIVIPVDSTLVGHVTEVKVSEKEDRPSRLGIVFDKVLLKHHVEVALRGVVHALAAPVLRRSKVDEPDPMLADAASGRGTGPIITSNMTPSHWKGNGRMDMIAASTPFPDSPGTAGRIGPMPDVTMPPAARPSLSIGTRLGVFGIKGLSLIPGSAGDGPVIWSEKDNVKLDNGVQVLVKVLDATGENQLSK